MKTIIKSAGWIILGAGLVVTGCAKKTFNNWSYLKSPAVQAQLKSFIAEKEAQVNSSTNEPAPGFAPYFAAAQRGDWLAVSNQFKDFARHVPSYQHSGTNDLRLTGTSWAAVAEVWGALDAFGQGNEKYSATYADDIIQSIPPGSIYFGGTDEGRFLITAMMKSQVNGDPFFALTQNALADGTYLNYLRSMYGDKIYLPTPADSQECFNDYSADAQKRMQNHQLRPGENVKTGRDGKLQISGQVAVMEINGLLVKKIFDKNTNEDFYVEESFPLDWMYPYLEPHGLIFRINRQPLPELSDDLVQQDHDYWTTTISPMIGNWLNDDTSITNVAAFVEDVFLRHDFSHFTGDPEFVKNDYSSRIFSKERCSLAGLYAWRANQAEDAGEKQRMNDAADFAFRQAWALCPYAPETVYRYVTLLTGEKRYADALLVAETAAKFHSQGGANAKQMRYLVSQLKRQHPN